MVEMAPNTLATLRSALIERCQLDTTNPRTDTATLNSILNEAISRFEIADPHCWPWDWIDTGQLAIDTSTPDPYSWQPGDDLFPQKVRDAFISDATQTWQFPLERMARHEQLIRYGRDSEVGTPRTYALCGVDNPAGDLPGVAMFLRPRPDRAYKLRLTGFANMPTLVSDLDPNPAVNDRQIDDWSDIVLEYAAHIIYRGAVDLSEAVSAMQAFDADVLSARKTAPRTWGAAFGNRPSAVDPELEP